MTATELPGAAAWALDPDFAHLNHGGFGATPACVLAAQQEWRAALERNPTDFLVRQLPELLAGVRAKIAAFLTADAEGVVFTTNATAGMQTVITQVALSPGDEVLTTDHCYPAIHVQLQHAASTSGARLRTARVPLTAQGAAEVTEAVVAQLTRRTRLLVLDQVASCSGMVFPVAEIAAECRRLGVPVLVDGAHATGMLEVNLSQLGADFWVGNLHKWVCAPKASAVLYAAPAWRDRLRPLVGSHAFHDGYQQAFDWTGTHDPTALLSVVAALEFFGQVGWEAVRQHNNRLASDGAQLVAERLGTRPPLSSDPERAASMRLVELPGPLTEDQARALERTLLTVHRVVVPVTWYDGWRWLRLSAQLYNTVGDYERLAVAFT